MLGPKMGYRQYKRGTTQAVQTALHLINSPYHVGSEHLKTDSHSGVIDATPANERKLPNPR